MTNEYLWAFVLIGFTITVLVELPIVYVGLSRRHSQRTRLIAGVWLTACTYPIVALVLPSLLPARDDRIMYLWIAEIFAPLAECVLFTIAFGEKEPYARNAVVRDCVAITVANVVSFGVGLGLERLDGWRILFETLGTPIFRN